MNRILVATITACCIFTAAVIWFFPERPAAIIGRGIPLMVVDRQQERQAGHENRGATHDPVTGMTPPSSRRPQTTGRWHHDHEPETPDGSLWQDSGASTREYVGDSLDAEARPSLSQHHDLEYDEIGPQLDADAYWAEGFERDATMPQVVGEWLGSADDIPTSRGRATHIILVGDRREVDDPDSTLLAHPVTHAQ